MSIDILSHFGALDELVQVIYEGFERFIVLSKIDYTSWTIHLGLLGDNPRWWKGSWLEGDFVKITGGKSEKVLEVFAGRLADSIRKGDLHVGGWGSDKIDLSLGTTKPLHVPLEELTQQDALCYATSVIFEIAKEAQSRKCQLHPTPFSPLPARGPSPLTTQASSSKQKAVASGQPPSSKTAATIETLTVKEEKAQQEIKALKVELAKEKEQKKLKSPPPDLSSKTVKRPPKGASLANPNKKARKYQELEFGSDDDG